jgi:hypothetical protein
MNNITLLHIAQTATRVTTVDLRVLAVAGSILAVAAALIWVPELSSFPRIPVRIRRRIAGHAVAALVFVAVFPSVVPYDHLIVRGHHDEAQNEVHASHCHISPGTCADAPVASGPGQLMLSEPLVIVPAMLGVLILLLTPALAGITVRPEVRPPLALRSSTSV